MPDSRQGVLELGEHVSRSHVNVGDGLCRDDDSPHRTSAILRWPRARAGGRARRWRRRAVRPNETARGRERGGHQDSA